MSPHPGQQSISLRIQTCARLLCGSLSGRLRFPALQFRLTGLLFHPLVELRFLKAPTVPQFESRNLLLVDVLVERVRTYAQVLRRLANVHNFARICHSCAFPQRFVAGMPTHARRYWEENPLESLLRVNLSDLSIYQPRIGRGQGRIPRFSGFFAVFLETVSAVVAGHIYILWESGGRYPLPVLTRAALTSPQ